MGQFLSFTDQQKCFPSFLFLEFYYFLNYFLSFSLSLHVVKCILYWQYSWQLKPTFCHLSVLGNFFQVFLFQKEWRQRMRKAPAGFGPRCARGCSIPRNSKAGVCHAEGALSRFGSRETLQPISIDQENTHGTGGLLSDYFSWRKNFIS